VWRFTGVAWAQKLFRNVSTREAARFKREGDRVREALVGCRAA